VIHDLTTAAETVIVGALVWTAAAGAGLAAVLLLGIRLTARAVTRRRTS
jgi:hypothetical protein